MKRFQITEAEYRAIQAKEAETKDKNVSRQVRALMLWHEGFRPSAPCHHIREYRYAFGAAEPLIGENFFLAMPYCNTSCTNTFLAELSKQYPEDLILLAWVGAAWRRSKTLVCPNNIQLLSIPPYTPEMNPIEQIWKQLRSMGFRNEAFHSLADVVGRLCDTICRLCNDMVRSMTGRGWIFQCFR